MAWLGLPGTALGGMNPRAGGPTLWTQPYSFSPSLDALCDVPVPVWSTKSLCARWNAPTKAFPQAELTDDNQLLVGTLVNTLDFPLEQCIVAYGRSVYELGTIGPGESARLGPMSRRSELKTLLTGRKVVFTETNEKYRQEVTPYDQSSTDVPYILRMMMFYQAAGGRALHRPVERLSGFRRLKHAVGGRSGDPRGPRTGRRTGEVPRRHSAPRRPAVGRRAEQTCNDVSVCVPCEEGRGEWRVESRGLRCHAQLTGT